MAYSHLVDVYMPSPCKTAGRKHDIDTISIHCMAGNLTVESCGHLFEKWDRQASSNYGIGSDGRIGCYVDEENRSWCTSSSSNDNRAITIEVANTKASHPYPVSDEAYKSLIELLVDICRRHKKTRLIWLGDKNKTLAYQPKQNEMIMTVHRWFANKACPGQALLDLHPEIAETVTNRLSMGDDDMENSVTWDTITAPLRDNDAGDWSKEARDWAIREGLIAGDGGNPPNYQWQAPLTREQFVVVLKRAIDKGIL